MDIQLTPKERGLVIKVIILVVVVGGLVYGADYLSNEYNSIERKLNSQLKSEQDDYRGRLAQIQVEEQLQSQYIEAYNRYQSTGLILGEKDLAEEQEQDVNETLRLQLLSRLQEIQQERGFFNLQYQLAQPENLPSSFSELTAQSDVAIRTNSMEFELPLLHSLDLLMLLNDFYDVQTNRFTPVECTMQSLVGYDDSEARRLALFNVNENIQARCRLVWLSVFDPKQGVQDTEEAS